LPELSPPLIETGTTGARLVVDESKVVRKRTKLIWIISIYHILGFVLIVATFFTSIDPGKGPLEQVLDFTLTCLPGALDFIGAIYLLKLRRHAFYLFAASLGVYLGERLLLSGISYWIQISGGALIIELFIGIGIEAAICLYAWRLMRRGVLV
jgi:hypothetical protein